MKPDRENEFEDEFMTELKQAIGSRNATLDEVIALINTKVVDEAETKAEHDQALWIISMLSALKTPDRL